MPNLILPGDPRYQPASLVSYFGYDKLVHFYILVEYALLEALFDIGVIPRSQYLLLTGAKPAILEGITTTQVDRYERRVTKHDIRALVHLMQKRVPPSARRWIHLSATSYDIIDTARILAFRQAADQVLFGKLNALILALAKKVGEYAETPQIGRTHGQHALPITVGFWLATILGRVLDIHQNLVLAWKNLRGKFSGAVGAYNAQEGLGIERRYQQFRGRHKNHGPKTFEGFVLAKLGLKPAIISTQIVPPEPLARFLHELFLLSGALAQLGHDVRNLQRSEIAEVGEAFESGQVGSSTMAHKRNPITFEGLAALHRLVRKEYTGVMDCLTSEHQRDLTTSATMRSFPAILVLTQYQVERATGALSKLTVNPAALSQNLELNRHVILSEPVYVALQMAGYQGDAHELINHELVPRAQASGELLITELEKIAVRRKRVREAYSRIPPAILYLLNRPESYTGRASGVAQAMVRRAERLMG